MAVVPQQLYVDILDFFKAQLNEEGTIKDEGTWKIEETRSAIDKIFSEAQEVASQGEEYPYACIGKYAGILKGYTNSDQETDGKIGVSLVNLAGALFVAEWIVTLKAGDYPIATFDHQDEFKQVYLNTQHFYEHYINNCSGMYKVDGNTYKHDFLPKSLELCFCASQIAKNDEGFVAEDLRRLIEGFLSGLGDRYVYPTVEAFNSPFYDHLIKINGRVVYLQYSIGSSKIDPPI